MLPDTHRERLSDSVGMDHWCTRTALHLYGAVFMRKLLVHDTGIEQNLVHSISTLSTSIDLLQLEVQAPAQYNMIHAP